METGERFFLPKLRRLTHPAGISAATRCVACDGHDKIASCPVYSSNARGNFVAELVPRHIGRGVNEVYGCDGLVFSLIHLSDLDTPPSLHSNHAP